MSLAQEGASAGGGLPVCMVDVAVSWLADNVVGEAIVSPAVLELSTPWSSINTDESLPNRKLLGTSCHTLLPLPENRAVDNKYIYMYIARSSGIPPIETNILPKRSFKAYFCIEYRKPRLGWNCCASNQLIYGPLCICTLTKTS